MKSIITIFFICVNLIAYSQANLDSLWKVWNNSSLEDSARLKAMKDISWDGYLFTNPDSAFYFAQIQFDFAEKKGLKKHMSNALNTQGVSFAIRGDNSKALEYYKKCLKLRREIDDKKGVAASLHNIGNLYLYKGDYDEALNYFSQNLITMKEIGDRNGLASTLNNLGIIATERGDYAKGIDYYAQSLKIQEEIGDKQGIAYALNNIGVIYKHQNDIKNAIDFFERSLEIRREIKDDQGISAALHNIANAYDYINEFNLALEYYQQSMLIKEELGDRNGYAISLGNIGLVHKKQGDIACNSGEKDLANKKYNEALDYYNRAIAIHEELAEKKEIAIILNNIARAYLKKKELNKAREYGEKSLSIASEIGLAVTIRESSFSLYETFKALNDSKNALEMYQLHVDTRDSIDSEKNRNEVIRQEYKYKYEKQAAEDSVINAEAQKVKDAQLQREKAENMQHQLANKQQRQKALFLYGIIGLALVFALFIFNRFTVTRKQKDLIVKQKITVDKAFDELEEKNKEIMDSIAYARRIQSAILPPKKIVKEYLEDSFILYKPKDIVAGDFYWLEQRNGKVLFAAADCTGHGVPGAMVSVVCNNGLNRSVREHNLLQPSKILEKTRDIVIEEFEKSEEEVKDGMDVALCVLDKENMELQYSGANNPLWIIRKSRIPTHEVSEKHEYKEEDYSLIEIKADKQPIGKYTQKKDFTNHSIILQPNDTIYIFSDGYVDQFGGEKGKKFKSKAFKELLLEIQDHDMEIQRDIINDAFENWRGDNEQIDDVCVIGVRVK